MPTTLRGSWLCMIFGVLVGVAALAQDGSTRRQDAEEVLLYPVVQDGFWRFINKEGDVVIHGPFEYAKCFHEGLAAVQVGQKWGFVDKTGKLVVKPEYRFVGRFSEGLASIGTGGKRGYVDRRGRIVIEPRFQPLVRPFSEGLAPVRVGEGLYSKGFIDKTGTLVIKPQFAFVRDFSEGLAPVYSANDWGYIDRQGQMVIEPRFADAGSFSEGLAAVQIGLVEDTRAFYIDKNGKPVLTLDPSVCCGGRFSEGLAYVQYWGKRDKWVDRKLGFIDKKGRAVTPPIFSGVGSFSEGLAAARLEKKWGYIDKEGNVKIEMSFDAAGSFSNGVAQVWMGENVGYIDRSGKYIWDPRPKGVREKQRSTRLSPYDSIDVKLMNDTIKILKSAEPDQREKRIAEIKKAPQNYAPPVFYAMSHVLFREGEKDEAAFWFYAGQLRARFDANRCADVTARQAVAVLNNAYGTPINKYAMQRLDKLEQLIPKIVDWDRKVPHEYDHRWINLHGMDAVIAGMRTQKKPEERVMSLPQPEWDGIAEKTRKDYLDGFRRALRQLKRSADESLLSPSTRRRQH